ncbi:negative regulation of transcription by glucose-related protein [Trichosporon asahii var. asahii CBS 8904]|jgi:ESCRT-II complex subunit VPS22|uniref:Negative regulation of transcription by glucose-related protein n=1 Tax=Trichosporon asahii var. asahii (strain CBS 8904) TaxID=1220162 RepID=K1VIT5_TRIAC|nr:negative regulation of transcription by glucose-related protein [Trichosporon asahii var. asahii CBS 8904]
MRKGAGISALQRHTATASSYSALSSTLSSQQLTSLETSLASFREELSRFASLHGAEIRRDPAFRHQFQRMCAAIGIDPLAASGSAKPSWFADSLGLREWTCALALQVVDVCVSTRERNGGVIELGELTQRVRRMRDTGSSKEEITEEDVRKAIDTLEPLHAGYRVSEAGGVTYVRTVPRELDTDQSMLLVLASETGGQLTAGGIQSKTGWSRVRAETALGDCVMREGMGWVDDVDGSVWLVAAVDFED